MLNPLGLVQIIILLQFFLSILESVNAFQNTPDLFLHQLNISEPIYRNTCI